MDKRIEIGDHARVNALAGANLALKFGLELVALAGFATWGASLDGTAVAILAAVIVPLIAIGLWRRLAAPQSPRRLPDSLRVPFELTVFGLGALAFLAAGDEAIAIAFAATALVNAALLAWLPQQQI